MSATDSIDGIAMEKNWIAMADRLRAAMESFRDYGMQSPQQLIEAVAHAQGVHATSLKKPLVASAWLEDQHPGTFAQRPVGLPMSQVLQLKRLHAISPTKAGEVAEAVFAAKIPRHVLEEIISVERAKFVATKGVHERTARPGPARAAKEFEREVECYLKSHIGEIVAGANVDVRRGDKLMPPVDFVIYRGDEPVMAVEAKASREDVHERHLLELLGINVLRQQTTPEIMVIGSQDWEPRFKRLADLGRELGLKGFTFATLEYENDKQKAATVLKIIQTNPLK